MTDQENQPVSDKSECRQPGLSCFQPDTFALISITGKDAADFLHRQVSNEIRPMKTGEGIPTCLLSREGHVLLYFHLWKTVEGFLALVAGAQSEQFIPLFDRVLFREEVKLEPAFTGNPFYLLSGPELESHLGDAALFAKPGCMEIKIDAENSTQSLTFGVDWLPECALLCCFPVACEKEFGNMLKEQGFAMRDSSKFHSLRIEKGTPWPGYEIRETLLPYDCGLEKAFSLTKGCYVGQEVVSRIHHLGKPPRALCGLIIDSDSPPAIGAKVMSGNIETGEILSAAYSKHPGKAIATSSLRQKFSQPGTGLTVEGKAAVVAEFPIA